MVFKCKWWKPHSFFNKCCSNIKFFQKVVKSVYNELKIAPIIIKGGSKLSKMKIYVCYFSLLWFFSLLTKFDSHSFWMLSYFPIREISVWKGFSENLSFCSDHEKKTKAKNWVSPWMIICRQSITLLYSSSGLGISLAKIQMVNSTTLQQQNL